MDARQHALIHFHEACQRDEFVIAAFVGGSIAAKTADDVSDVDLYAVTLQPDYERFFARRQAFMRTWARPLLLVDTLNFEGLGFDMLHFVLDDGVYGELALGHAGNFRVMHGGPHQVLVDKTGLLNGVTFAKYVASPSELQQQAQRALDWFWLDYVQFRKQLHRGHSVAAANLLARLRTHCASLLALARAQYLNFDREVLNERLAATVDSVDPARSARAMAGLHQEIGSAIAAHFGVDYPLEVAQLFSRD